MRTDTPSSQFKAAAQHLETLRQQASLLSREQRGPFDEAVLGLSRTLRWLQEAYAEVSRRDEERATLCSHLEARSAYYEGLFERTPFAWLVTDLSGSIQVANSRATSLLRASKELLVGRQLAAFLPEQEHEAFGGQLAKLQEGRQLQDWEVRLQPASGDPAPVSLSAAPIHDSEHGLVGLQWALRDLGRQTEAEDALRRSERLLRSLFEQHQDGIALADEQGRMVEWNQSMEQMTGLSGTEIRGQPIWDVQFRLSSEAERTPAGYEQLKAGIQHLLETGQAPWLGRVLEREYARPDGSIRILQGVVFSIRSERGFLLGSVTRDVTEARRSEKALLESEAKYRLLVENLHDGIWQIDKDGHTTFANPRLADMLGCTVDEMIGTHVFAFIEEQDIALAEARLERRRQGIRENLDFRFRRKDGSVLYANLETTPLLDAQGAYAGALAGVADITDRRRAEEERERLLAEATQERQRAERLAESLAEERNTFRVVIESTHTQLAYLDPGFNFVLVNSAYAQGRGHTRDELVGRNHFALFPNAENQAIFERVRDTGEPAQFVAKPLEHADQPERGTTYWDWSLVPVRSLDGRVQGLVLSLLDATPQVKARLRIEALSAQSQRQADELTAILNAIPESVAVWDTQGVLLRANPASQRFGIGPEGVKAPLLVKRVDLRFPDGRAMLPEGTVVARTLRGETVLGQSETMVDTVGEQREILASGAPIFSGGKVVAAVVVMRDVTEQRGTERERERLLAENRAQREFLERLLEAAPVGIAVLRGPDHRYELVNPYYQAITGVPDTPMVGHTIVEVIPDLVNRRMPELMDEVYRTGQTVSTREVQLSLGPGRDETYWNTDRVPLRNPDGAVEGILVLAHEMTEEVRSRKRIEALSAQAQRQADEMAAIFSALVEPVMVFDAQGAIRQANPAAVEALGINPVGLPEAELARRMSACTPDGKPIRPPDLVAARALRGERVRDDYQLLLTAARDERAILVSGAPIVTDGRIAGAVLAWHDITDLRRAEAALRESEEKLSTLFELLPVGISILDEERRITKQNAALVQILGLPREALLHGGYRTRTYLRSDGTIMPPDEFPSARAEREQRMVHDQVGIVKEDGDVIWTDVSAAPVPFSDWRVVTATVDVTERKRVEQALRQAHDELELRVGERTTELQGANQMLLAEIRERARVEGELRRSEQWLEQRVNERTRELTTLLDISNTVALTIDLEALLALILERLKDVVDYSGGGAFRLEAGALHPVFHRGAIPPDELLRIGSHLEKAVLGHAVIQGPEHMILADVQSDPILREAFRQAASPKPAAGTSTGFEDRVKAVRAWMAVPVTIKQQVYGVLYMYHSQPGRYGEEQARLALPFGNQAAVAIENARLYAQAQRLAALEERQHLARELHDAVTQTLFSASLAAEVLPRLWERNRDAGLRCLSEVRQLTRGALAEMRTLLLELRPTALVETELGALLHQLAEAATSRARVPVKVEAVQHCTLPPEVQVALYRIAQEALNNVAKHAGAQHAEVELRSASPLDTSAERPPTTAVELCVADDGQGFDAAALPAGGRGLGLGIMRERAAAIGAAIHIQSHPGRGTRIMVTWPKED